MDFFERQDQARRNTKLLSLYFVIAVVSLILAIYIAVLLIFKGVKMNLRAGDVPLWDPQLFAGVAIATLAIIILGSVFKSLQLSKGGSAVAESLGGRLLSPNTTDLDERKLLNVVEEMALASGVPVPQVYVMDDEPGINAFAAGHSTSDAVVGVTRGCMKLLSRDELQGVIAHEFSHILNGDMRLNLRLVGIIFGILCISVVGRVLLQSGRRSAYRLNARDRGSNPLPLLGLALLLLGSIGVFFGRLIQAAVSRQREFLADASAVQFTRNPAGLTGALKKIGGLVHGSKLESAHAGEASHMFFGNSLGQSLFGLMATHPPLNDRIRAIDPQFDGKFPRVSGADAILPVRDVEWTGEGGVSSVETFLFPGGLKSETIIVRTTTTSVPPPIPARIIMPNIGAPAPAHLQYAVELRNSFSPPVQEAAHNPLGAAALIYGLLLSSDPAVRARQLELLGQISAGARQETERLLPHVDAIAVHAKLPLADLALPALRHCSGIQYEEFRRALGQLIECDGEIDLFEYVLEKVVLRHLDSHFHEARKSVIQYYAIRPLARDCAVLLSALAYLGTDDPANAEAAFQRGAGKLSYHAQAELMLVPEAECDLPQVDTALDKLNQAVPQIKKNVLDACAQTVAADGLIQEMEAELLRAIADTLDCPMPPFVQPAPAP